MIKKQSLADVLQNRCSKNLANFTGKHLRWSLFLETLQNSSPVTSETLTQVFSCESCEIFKNIFFYRAPPVAAFGDNKCRVRLFTLSKQAFVSQRVSFLKWPPIIRGFIDD